MLIVVGGPPGSGKSAICRRLSASLSIPTLGSDLIGRTIKASAGVKGRDAWPTAYAVVYAVCEDFLDSGVSVILDLNMGWAFQWQWLDRVRASHPNRHVVPILLTCPRNVCLDRIGSRHASDSSLYAPTEFFTTNPNALAVWEFLDNLDRPEVQVVDANRPLDAVYADVECFVKGG